MYLLASTYVGVFTRSSSDMSCVVTSLSWVFLEKREVERKIIIIKKLKVQTK